MSLKKIRITYTFFITWICILRIIYKWSLRRIKDRRGVCYIRRYCGFLTLRRKGCRIMNSIIHWDQPIIKLCASAQILCRVCLAYPASLFATKNGYPLARCFSTYSAKLKESVVIAFRWLSLGTLLSVDLPRGLWRNGAFPLGGSEGFSWCSPLIWLQISSRTC